MAHDNPLSGPRMRGDSPCGGMYVMRNEADAREVRGTHREAALSQSSSELRQRAEKVRGLDTGSTREQILQTRLQSREFCRQAGEPLLALGWGQIQRLIEQPIERGRALRIEFESRHRLIRVCFAVSYDDQRALRTFSSPVLGRAADAPSPSPGG